MAAVVVAVVDVVGVVVAVGVVVGVAVAVAGAVGVGLGGAPPMTTQLSLALNYAAREKTPRLMGSGSKWDGCELGYTPATGVQWTRTRPAVPGVYPVVGRDGGLWLGDTRHTRDDWRGWWCSAPVEVTRALKRPLPPAGDWGER